MSDSPGNWLQVGLLGTSQTVDRIGVKQWEMEVPIHDTHTYVPLHPTSLPPLVSWHPEPSSGHSGCGAVVETFTAWLHPAWLIPDLLVSYSKIQAGAVL